MTVSAERVVSCDCHACELGDPAMCYGCPTHGAWCDWRGGHDLHAAIERTDRPIIGVGEKRP